jgi:hypothetical protein
MTPADRLDIKRTALRRWLKPYAMVRDVAHRDTWEAISYPWVDGGRILVNVRSTPGDPTTMITVDALALEPAGKGKL